MTHKGIELRTLMCAILIGVGTLISSCGNTGDTMGTPAERRDMDRSTTITPDVEIDEADRREALSKLEDLRDDIDDHIKDVDSHMRDTENETRLNNLREYRLELERQRARVTDEMRNIEVSEPTTWQTVRQTANETAKDVGDWFDRQGDRIEQLFTNDTDDDDMDGDDTDDMNDEPDQNEEP